MLQSPFVFLVERGFLIIYLEIKEEISKKFKKEISSVGIWLNRMILVVKPIFEIKMGEISI